MMTICIDNCNKLAGLDLPGTQESVKHIVFRWIAMQALKRQVYLERKQLMEMSEAMLKDMGLTHAEVAAEARRNDLPQERMATLQNVIC
jgi:uncharacterized protein YjiS (DUF1127 family)